jgi:hypothetical protein
MKKGSFGLVQRQFAVRKREFWAWNCKPGMTACADQVGGGPLPHSRLGGFKAGHHVFAMAAPMSRNPDKNRLA